MVKVPRSYDELTTTSLTAMLSESGFLQAGNNILDFTIEPVGAGLGYLSFLYRITPTYSDPSGLPTTLIAKFPSTEAGSRLTGNLLRGYERESLFYEYSSNESPLAPPAGYFSYSNPEADDYLIIIEDLDGCRFVNQTDGVKPEDAIHCFRALAAHHARYWNRLEEIKWAPLFSDFGQLYTPLMAAGVPLMEQNWGDRFVPTYADHVDTAVSKYGAVVKQLQKLPTTLIHCDTRIENIAFDGNTPRFFDWQLTAQGPAAYDLMYFFQHSMDADIRRTCQDELFDAYLEVLANEGIDYPKAQLLEDIGLATCTVWGFIAMIGNFFFRNETNELVWKMTLPRSTKLIEDFGGIEYLSRI